MQATPQHATPGPSRRPSAVGPPLRRFRQARKRGFSLMEVTIAVAIIAFTCIPLIGMLPAGMKTMRDGQREAVGAEIVRLLTNELSMSNWGDTNDLETWEDHLRYFDSEGIPLESDDLAVFTAKIEVGDETTLPGAPYPNPFLKRVTIKVTHKPEVLNDRFTNPKFHRTYSMLIAKMDK
jgi:uncharacterized protein (TIGR02598 family)